MPETSAAAVPPLRPPASSASTALGWMQACVRCGADAWSRGLGAAATAAGRGARDAGNGLMRGAGPGAIAAGLARSYATGIAECLAAATSAAEAAAAPGPPSARPPSARPPSARQIHSVDGRRVTLPARLRDAAQGWAIYFVDANLAAAALGPAAKEFRLLDVGAGRSPLVITGTDARDGDFGPYVEIAVALLVQPRGQSAAMPLAYPLAIAVSQPFPEAAARTVWGLPTTLCPKSAAIRRPDTARFAIAPGALAIEFPRFGDGRSAALPIHLLSMRDDHAMRSLATRSGADEGRQIGGSVHLVLGVAAMASCLCRDRPETCVCATLRKFDIAGCFPAANGWTETMTGELGAPAPL